MKRQATLLDSFVVNCDRKRSCTDQLPRLESPHNDPESVPRLVSSSSHTETTAPVLPKDCEILLQKGLSDAQKLELMLHFPSFNPSPTFQFPTTVECGKKRSFQHRYLQMYKWLGYSVKLDACLCLPCSLFGDAESAQNFAQKPVSNWTTFNNKVKGHSTCLTHINCVLAMTSFMETHSGIQPTIDTSLNRRRQEMYDLNCRRLDAIIDCILLCGQQNIALRGHRDSNPQLQDSNKGNFKAILEFRALGDPVLQEHLSKGQKNAQYTSPRTQNEIISICKSLVLQKVVDRVKENELYSIICDECSDSSNRKQLSLSVRYVSDKQIQESFLGFFELDEGVTGESIATIIETALAECHLDPTKMRGQAYDGATNMSGCYKGCAAIIQKKYPLAVYSHCCSHALNLAVVNACSLVQVQNLFSTISKVYYFFDNHPKRQYVLSTFCDGSSRLKSLCQTRWLQRIDALHIFVDLFDNIIKSFDQVSNNSAKWSRDSLIDATSLSKAMLNCEFIITLHVVERYMSYTGSLTISLQARALDIIQAVKHIATLKQVLTDARSDIDTQFHVIYEGATRHAERYGVAISTPRRCSIQTARDNHPGTTAEEYYCRSLAIPFLDHLQNEIESRFTSHSLTAMRCLGIIPACFSFDNRATDEEMLEFFKDDLSFPSAAKAELELWHSHFSGVELPDTPRAAFEQANPLIFPNVRRMLVHVMVLPVTSCEAERSFSALRRIKTYLRSTMTQERLNGLALLNVHAYTSHYPSTAEVRAQFLLKNRRLMEDASL